MDLLRAHAREVRGPCPAEQREADFQHHVRLSNLMRRADDAHS